MTTATMPILFDDYGLSAFTFRPVRRATLEWHEKVTSQNCHTHMEIEMMFVEAGAVTLEHTGRRMTVEAGELAVFWAGLPHQSFDPENDATYHVTQIPVVSVLSWLGHTGPVQGLLKGEVLRSTVSGMSAAVDELMFARWARDLSSSDPTLVISAELEVQARLRRLLREAMVSDLPGTPRADRASAELTGKTIRYVTRRFMEHLTIEDIARHVGRHHDHVMATFRKTCGITLWDYVTRLRLSEAQRLLATTDLPILTICHRVGFSSTSRMYEAFHRLRGLTPAEFRQHAG